MYRKSIITIIAICWLLNLKSQSLKNELVPVQGQLELNGILGARFDNNLETRVKNMTDLEEFLSYYEHPIDTFRWFSGEHIGKWLVAACNSYKYKPDNKLKELIDRCIYRLQKQQLDNGYLGSYKPGYRFFELNWNQIDHIKKQTWHFDTWNHNLLMIGLLTHHEVFNDRKSLEMAKKIAELYMDIFGGDSNKPNGTFYQSDDGKVDILASNPATMFSSGATCAIYPFAWLYELEGNDDYLAFCNYIKSRYYSVIGPRFLLTNDPNNRQNYHRKPCEDFLNFLGFINLYRTTLSDTMLVSASNNFHQFVEFNRVEENQGLGLDYLCDICPFAIFCIKMFELTGDIKYMNIVESVIYNSINAHDAGASCAVAGNVSFFGSNGFKCMAHGSHSFCCYTMNSMMISYFPQIFYWTSQDQKSLVVNFYEDSHVNTKINNINVDIYQKTLYPLNGNIQLAVDPREPVDFMLKLRVPSFSEAYSLKINSKLIKDPQISEGFIIIQRNWRKGDQLEVEFKMDAKGVDYGMITLVPKNLRRLKGSKETQSLSVQKGPITWVFDPNYNRELTDFSFKREDLQNGKLTPNPNVLSGYQYEVESDKGLINLIPFADAGKAGGTFDVWLPVE